MTHPNLSELEQLEKKVQDISSTLRNFPFLFQIKKEENRLPRLLIKFGSKHYSCFSIGLNSIFYVETFLDNGKPVDNKVEVCKRLKYVLPNFDIL